MSNERCQAFVKTLDGEIIQCSTGWSTTKRRISGRDLILCKEHANIFTRQCYPIKALRFNGARAVLLMTHIFRNNDIRVRYGSLKALTSLINQEINKLPDQNRMALVYHFGFDDRAPKSYEVVGTMMGITRERVRQVEAMALRLLRHPSRSNAMRNLLIIKTQECQEKG